MGPCPTSRTKCARSWRGSTWSWCKRSPERPRSSRWGTPGRESSVRCEPAVIFERAAVATFVATQGNIAATEPQSAPRTPSSRRKTMKMKMLIGAGALAVVIGAGAAWAHGPGRGFMSKQMINKRVAALEDAIQATPQQRAQIEQSRDTILNALQAQHQAGAQNHHQQLMQMLTAD